MIPDKENLQASHDRQYTMQLLPVDNPHAPALPNNCKKSITGSLNETPMNEGARSENTSFLATADPWKKIVKDMMTLPEETGSTGSSQAFDHASIIVANVILDATEVPVHNTALHAIYIDSGHGPQYSGLYTRATTTGKHVLTSLPGGSEISQ